MEIDLEKYPLPNELPEMTLMPEGVLRVDYKNIYITPSHVVHAIKRHRELCPDSKLPILAIGEAATDIRGGMVDILSSKEQSDVTSAVAIVTKGQVASALGNIFLKVQRNPFPTKIFKNESAAKQWLLQYLP